MSAEARAPWNRSYVGLTRSTRGGSYDSPATEMRVSARRPLSEDGAERLLRMNHPPTFGFRCVREIPSP